MNFRDRKWCYHLCKEGQEITRQVITTDTGRKENHAKIFGEEKDGKTSEETS